MSVNESKARKNRPLWGGCMMYFPDALLAVAEHSRKANDKHNSGEPLHWSKEKSKDHADCIARHLIDIGPEWDAEDPEFDPPSLHAAALAWRALALLQTVLERRVLVVADKAAPVISDSDGWIEWKGGECPVARDVLVRVRLRNQYEAESAAGAWYWGWQHWLRDGDIIAYKVVG